MELSVQSHALECSLNVYVDMYMSILNVFKHALSHGMVFDLVYIRRKVTKLSI